MADIEINLDDADKDEIIPPDERAGKSAREQWHAQRDFMVDYLMNEVDPTEHTEKEFLKAIMIVMTKIYWELRKPKR